MYGIALFPNCLELNSATVYNLLSFVDFEQGAETVLMQKVFWVIVPK